MVAMGVMGVMDVMDAMDVIVAIVLKNSVVKKKNLYINPVN
jgi:hypothetical protein